MNIAKFGNRTTNMNNPYQPTAEVGRSETIVIRGIPFEGDLRRGRVGQVQILGVLMVVHGVLDVMAAVAMGGYAFFMPQLMRQAAANGGNPMPPNVDRTVMLTMIGLAAVYFFAGVGNLVGGVWAIQFRRRPWVIAGLVGGLLMLMSCYCFPTSLVLFVYGLFVMLGPSVVYAFELRKQGHSVKEIQEAFWELAAYG